MEDKIVIDNTQVFSDSLEIDKTKPMRHSIQGLYFQMFQHLQSQIGLHSDLECTVHFSISKVRKDYTDKEYLYGRMETIPTVLQHLTVANMTPIEPNYSGTKLKFFDRLKILIKGKL